MAFHLLSLDPPSSLVPIPHTHSPFFSGALRRGKNLKYPSLPAAEEKQRNEAHIAEGRNKFSRASSYYPYLLFGWLLLRKTELLARKEYNSWLRTASFFCHTCFEGSLSSNYEQSVAQSIRRVFLSDGKKNNRGRIRENWKRGELSFSMKNFFQFLIGPNISSGTF